jgi:hypothetical protein
MAGRKKDSDHIANQNTQRCEPYPLEKPHSVEHEL